MGLTTIQSQLLTTLRKKPFGDNVGNEGNAKLVGWLYWGLTPL